jgi:hypothetical protein
MRPPEAQRRSAAARARPKTPSIASERRAAIAKSQVVSTTLVAGAYFTLVAGAYFEVSYCECLIHTCGRLGAAYTEAGGIFGALTV